MGAGHPYEAILILGALLPEARYFGLQSYVFTRQGNHDTDSLKISMRDYIYPGTQRGPAALLKRHSMVITLHKP